jgi:hypothetical protein
MIAMAYWSTDGPNIGGPEARATETLTASQSASQPQNGKVVTWSTEPAVSSSSFVVGSGTRDAQACVSIIIGSAVENMTWMEKVLRAYAIESNCVLFQ